MRPKKRDRDRNSQQEQHKLKDDTEADREQFLRAFEKPTQIYRYLRTRNSVSPLFLHSNLTYMKRKKSSRKRETFKLDSLLAKVQNQNTPTDRYKSQYMNINFNGFYHEDVIGFEKVEVEAVLLKICHKKRKDVSSPVMQASQGKVSIPVNPPSSLSLESHTATISIGHENFNHNNGHSVKSFVLVLTVRYPIFNSIPNGVCNGDLHSLDEPLPKRRKNGKISSFDDGAIYYSAELVIYDKHKRCQLEDGDYEIVLQEMGSKQHLQVNASWPWETTVDGKPVGSFEVFNQGPTLRFTIGWSDKAQEIHDNSASSGIRNAHNEFLNNNQLSNHIMSSYDSGTMCANSMKEANQTTPKKKLRIFYQFLYNNNARQQTEARDDLHCPWCSLNCKMLYNLLKHLRLCHARFNFIYVPHPKGARIDVSINERYDGSYIGNPQDIHSHIGYAFSRNGPVRRTPVTNVIVYRPKRPECTLLEFMEPENDNQINRQFMQGHNRLYYHTWTTQPVTPKEIHVDSEDENDPVWLRQKTVKMIDEFTDVNEGEKELMKLWNLHIMKYNFIADCQIPEACEKFVENHGKEVILQNLCRNFILHMVNLFDFSLIGSETIHRTLALIERTKEELEVSD